MRKQQRPQSEPIGQDSFLDIVANLVGILIILVILIGARAKGAWVEAAIHQAAESESGGAPLPPTSRAVEANIHELDAQAASLEQMIEIRRLERERVHTLLTAAERQIEEDRQRLGDEEQRKYDAQRALLASRAELDEIDRARRSLENAAAQKVEVIEHTPTPLAQTVFTREVHFRLQGGRLVYVPWNELLARFQADAPQQVWKLQDADEIVETIGPIAGFQAKYSLRRGQYVVETRGGPVVQTGVEFQGIVVESLSDDLGEPLDRALQPQSQFRSNLGGLNPDDVTITVWVYPDSFHQFRTLKAELTKLGFAAAARPLPEGFPIGGAPSGTRSAAQ
jgi:hypothetical protein